MTPTRPPQVTLSAENLARLRTYPRPPRDNGIGLHFHLDLSDHHIGETIEHLQTIRATWTMIYAQDELLAESAATACFRAGIMPVVRIGRLIDESFDPEPYVHALRRALAASDFPHDPAHPPLYVQIYNEPEDSREWLPHDKPQGWQKPVNWPQIFGHNWAYQAARVYDAGGYPGIQVLDRDGFDQAVDAVAAMNRRDIWQRAFFAHHNYGENHPPSYPYDARNQQDKLGCTILQDYICALRFQAHASWMQERLGFVLPLIGGEGGWLPGSEEDKRYPKVEPPLHAVYTDEMFQWLRSGVLSNGEPLPDYLFSITAWVAGSWTFPGQNWWDNSLMPDGKLTQTIEAMRAIPPFERRFSWQGATPVEPPPVAPPAGPPASLPALRKGDWVDPFNLQVLRCEERPDRPEGEIVYRLVDLWTTRDGSWDPGVDTPGRLPAWARDAYLKPSGAADYFDDAGADHHLFARVLDLDGNPVITPDLVMFWSDGIQQLGDPGYQGYVRVTPKSRSGWANQDDGSLDVIVAPVTGKGIIFYQAGHQAGDTVVTQTWGTNDQQVSVITTGDFDGDGKLDFVATQIGPSSPILYLNTSQPTFKYTIGGGKIPAGVDRNKSMSQPFFESKTPFGGDLGGLQSVAAGDLNGDGSLDLVVGIGAERWLSRVMLNNGDGSEFSPESFGPANRATRAVMMADMNDDGLLDIITGNKGFGNTIYLNGKETIFTSTRPGPKEESSYREITSVAVGDLDGDGQLDIVTGSYFLGTVKEKDSENNNLVLINQGNGQFEPKSLGLKTNRDIGSIALADLNGDGRLDVVAGTHVGVGTVYFSVPNGDYLTFRHYDLPRVSEKATIETTIATGDLDHKKGIDLVACSLEGGCTIYPNDGGGHFIETRTLGVWEDRSTAVAIFDLNGDGNLDIVVGNEGMQNYVYYNDGQGKFPTDLRRPYGTGGDFTRAIAVADVDADGWPDILVANFFERGMIYLNDGAGGFPLASARPFGGANDRVYSLATGDINGDGYVDFVAGHWESNQKARQNTLYLNDGQGNFVSIDLDPTKKNWTRSVALGDMDGNGTLDIIEGNRYGQERLLIHRNRLRDPASTGNRMPSLLIGQPSQTQGVVSVTFTLRDHESDKIGRVILDYALDGGVWKRVEITDTSHLATSPDGKSYQIAWDPRQTGVFGRFDNVVLRLRAYPQPDRPAEPGTYRYTNTVPALNQWPYIVATTSPFSIQGTSVAVFRDQEGRKPVGAGDALVYRLPAGKERGAAPLGGVDKPFRTATDGFLPGHAEIKAGQTVTDSDRLVAVWPAAVVTATTPTRVYISNDTFPMTTTIGSPVRTRLVVPDARRIADIRARVDITPDVTVTLSLVLPRGERVSVDANTGHITPTLSSLNNPLADGQWTLEISADQPVQLRGWGLELKLSPLNYTSAAPTVRGLDAYTVTASSVQTSTVQTLTVSSQNPLLLFDLNVALEWNAVNDEHYQAQLDADLRRASELLYDWTNGQVALGNVRVYHDAPRNVLPDGANAWNDAHIRIYASNRLRPNADQGGIISEPYTETVQITKTISYLPGQVRIGATWNRYGDTRIGNLGDDWAAALAHELGHYLLFLDDNYLSLQQGNLLEPLRDDDCPSAMNNPYSNAYSEFHPEQGWSPTEQGGSPNCRETMSALNTGRSDWATIQRFYPELNTPTVSFTAVLTGPSLLPLAVTQVTWQEPDPNSDTLNWLAKSLGVDPDVLIQRECRTGAPWHTDRAGTIHRGDQKEVEEFGCPTGVVTSTAPLEVPIFYLKLKSVKEDDTYKASSQARAFLFQGEPYPTVIDLGQPGQDQIYARGARPLDRLCIYDPPQNLAGCINVEPGQDQIIMQPADNWWKPQLLITPVTTRTLQISVTLPLTDTAPNKRPIDEMPILKAWLYPIDGPALRPITLTGPTKANNSIIYSGTITTTEPVLEGYVWIGDPNDTLGPYQTITEFTIGGNPVRIRARRSPTDQRTIRTWARYVRLRARRAPAASADGQVTIYPDEEILPLDREWVFTLQPATRLPAELLWATPVGHAYWRAASENITDTGNSSISFEYFRSDVPAGEEAFVRMYFWVEKESRWRLIEGQKHYPEHNFISAPVQGTGLYALFSHYEIPLQPGWNLIGYPVQTAGVPVATRGISQTLRSIAGQYSAVYGYYACDTQNVPLKVYAPEAPDWVNDLKTMDFGLGYWINVTSTEPITLYLKGSSDIHKSTTTPTCPGDQAGAMLHPPSTTYYGKLTADADFFALPGLSVIARVDGIVCGRGMTQSGDDGIHYAVAAEAASLANDWKCGGSGKVVTFEIDGHPLQPQAQWSSSGIELHDLARSIQW